MTELFSNELTWKDSNLALFGSDLDKQVKKEAAMTEEAWLPVLRVDGPKLFVWRIEKFQVKPVNPNDYGQFFNGDSYIVLNVRGKGDKLLYDVHFWVGQKSTQDEYGTAAYKTVELDTLLDGVCVEHREVEGYESNLFKSYFPNLRILQGGVDSGFRNVNPNQYNPRLLHFCLQDRKLVVMQEVDLSANSLNSGDVFILDLGSAAYQWNGRESNKEERYAAAQFLAELEHERLGKCKGMVLDEDNVDDHDEFMRLLPNVPIKRSQKYLDRTKCVFRLSDESGRLRFELIASNSAPKKKLTNDDVYFIDTGSQLFVYIGVNCSMREKQNALSYAHSYLQNSTHPLVPITVVRADQDCEELDSVWDPDRSKFYTDE